MGRKRNGTEYEQLERENTELRFQNLRLMNLIHEYRRRLGDDTHETVIIIPTEKGDGV